MRPIVMNKTRCILSLLLFCSCVLPPRSTSAAVAYDPLAIPGRFAAQTLDLSVLDAGRERQIPIRIYLPSTRSPVPVVLYSPGLGGSRNGSAYLGNHWAARGYVAVFLQHPGSDSSVWRDQPVALRFGALQAAANVKNFLHRVGDVHSVLNQLNRWNLDHSSALFGRLNVQRIGMAGHSFGAVTTQAVSGQHFPVGPRSMTDSRIKAAVIFSPSSPRRGDPGLAFGAVSIPWMLMTGTNDRAPIGQVDLASRLAVFTALPPKDKYELVLDGAEHSAFTDRPLPGDREPRNPNHHRAILALSTAFWDSYLRDNAAAKAWLNGTGPRSMLQNEDRWQTK
jgi:predicted dienelactone hydrolase